MSHIPNYVIISLNTHKYRPPVPVASLMQTLWVSLCGAPNEIASHVEGMKLRRGRESMTINCTGVSQYMQACKPALIKKVSVKQFIPLHPFLDCELVGNIAGANGTRGNTMSC